MNNFYKNGLSFSCTGCSVCCRHETGFVYISTDDLKKMLDFFAVSKEVFFERYCRWIDFPDGRQVLCLKEKANFDCIFWDGGCTAYEVRPLQCSLFPFWERNLDSPEEWQKASQDCPGINHGQLFSEKDIESRLEACRNNRPLDRKTFLR